MKLNIKKLQKFVIVFFIFCFFQPLISAQNYYADIKITVDETGLVDIKGVSNHPDLLVENSHLYTYKKQSIWLLNITKDEIFSDYIYELTFPENTKISLIRAIGFEGIEQKAGRFVITGSGTDEKLSIYVKYQINNSDNLIYNIILGLLIISIFVIAFILIYFIYKDKKSKIGKEDKSEYNFKGLSKRQKDIVKLLIENKRPLTQRDIQKELDMPKAAVSRNVHSLEIKGLIEIEKTGMSNLIRLKKP